MTRRGAAFPLVAVLLTILPLDAQAQKVPWIALPLAVSPLAAILLSVILGIAMRSWFIGLANTGLVLVWVAWFVVASKYVPSDPVIWASITALSLHCLVMLFLIAQHAFRRARRHR